MRTPTTNKDLFANAKVYAVKFPTYAQIVLSCEEGIELYSFLTASQGKQYISLQLTLMLASSPGGILGGKYVHL